MKNIGFLLLVLIAVCFYSCKKDKSVTVDDRCHLPVNGLYSFSEQYFQCGGGGGVYPNYFCGPALPGHANQLVIDIASNTVYITEMPGNVKGVIMDMGDKNCAFINEGTWSSTITDKVVPYTSGHCYFGLFPDGDTIRFYAKTYPQDAMVALSAIIDTALVPVHDSLFAGRYYNENDGWAGVIAYILKPGDPGYNPLVKHGLIAAPIDMPRVQNKPYIPWSNIDDVLTGASDSALGTGRANTDRIVLLQGPGYYAAYNCDTFAPGGHNGWYLPSLHELQKVYNSRDLIGGFDDFGTSAYWSSTEIDNQFAYLLNFGFGSYWGDLKSFGADHVRAVKSF